MLYLKIMQLFAICLTILDSVLTSQMAKAW